MAYPCIVCNLQVRPKQHAVQCDSCNRWQHRLCQSGISFEQYKQSRKQGYILWTCYHCTSSRARQPPTLEQAVPLEVNSSPEGWVPQPPKKSNDGRFMHSTGMFSSISIETLNESSIVVQSSGDHMSCFQSMRAPSPCPSASAASLPSSPQLRTAQPSPCWSLSAHSARSTASSKSSQSSSLSAHSAPPSPSTPPSLPSQSSARSAPSPPFSSSQSSTTHDFPSSPASPDIDRLAQNSAVSFSLLESPQESNLQASLAEPGSLVSDEVQLQFVLVPGASKRGKDLLVEGCYTYVKDGSLKKYGHQRWRCCVRNKSLQCLASVIQKGDNFCRGAQPHLCAPSDCALPSAKIKRHVREEGRARPHASGATLVKEAIQQFLPFGAPASSMPTVSNLVRSTNRCRQKKRPKHPKSLEFAWEEEAIPSNFKQADLGVGSARHVVFFTAFLFSLLCSAKTWYVDATFKAVQKPFYQLWSIHAFVKQNQHIRQVPLLFAIMSRRCKADYKAILEFIKSQLPIAPRVVVMDFEAAAWGAFREVFGFTILRGCCFHWKQCVFRKIKELGLGSQYSKSSRSRRFLLELMSLPYLPAEQISETFNDLANLVKPSHDQAFHSLMEYVEGTWIHTNTFPPSSWSVFGHSVRTNNDVEGWHHGLNRMIARRGNENVNLNLYELVDVLHDVCMQVKMECRLISEEKLKKVQRREYLQFQSKLFDLWERFEKRELRPAQFLKQVSLLHTPVEDE